MSNPAVDGELRCRGPRVHLAAAVTWPLRMSSPTQTPSNCAILILPPDSACFVPRLVKAGPPREETDSRGRVQHPHRTCVHLYQSHEIKFGGKLSYTLYQKACYVHLVVVTLCTDFYTKCVSGWPVYLHASERFRELANISLTASGAKRVLLG